MAENRPPGEWMRIGKRPPQARWSGASGSASQPHRSAVLRRSEAASAGAHCAAHAFRARDERRPGLQAELPGMAVGRGPDRTRLGEGLRRCDCEPQRPPAADPHPFAGRLGLRRGGHGRTHSSQGPRGRRRQDVDHQLSGSLAEMPGRPRRRRSPAARPALRPACSCLPAGSNASQAPRRGSGCIRPPRW